MSYSRSEQRGWYFYDWANSAFSTTVVTLFFGPYVTTVLARNAADNGGFLHPFGIAVAARAYWEYLVAASVIVQVLVLPLAGAVADYGRRKKELLAATAYTGAAATIAMFFLEGSAYLAAGLLFLVANTAFGASIVIYNSFLAEIAPPEERDAVSSKGWGLGYLGGGVLLALNLLLYMRPSALGIDEGLAVRVSLASAGVWWAAFTTIPLRALRNRLPARRLARGRSAIGASLGQLTGTLRDMRRYPQTLLFLLAYLLYNDGIQTVIALATQFGHDELKIPMAKLALAILMVQFVAFFGALLFNRIAGMWNAKSAVMLSLAIWTAVVAAMHSWVQTTVQFFAMAAVVALVLGGSQALSRSLFSQMIPPGRDAEYFGIYEISDKGTSWLCPLVFGLAVQFTGSYRTAVLTLAAFFLAGLAVLARVDVGRAALEASGASAPPPAGRHETGARQPG
ncbi:MAG TPA: MFS transporter [Bryobacteraceae bacterium]|nr:MFS transporter [Bryobacteraceae bacterium]